MWVNDLATLVNGIATLGINCFASARPVIPNNDGPYLLIRPTSGSSPDFIQTKSTAAHENPGAQVMSIATDYVDAETQIYAAWKAHTVFNTRVNGTLYRSIVPRSSPADLQVLDAQGRVQLVYNVLGDRAIADAGVVGYMLIDDLGGDKFAFLIASGSDVYPAGSTFDKLVPGSWPVTVNAGAYYNGTAQLECSARVQTTGARAKVALVDLAAPNTPLVEITFSANQVLGETLRSAVFNLPTPGDRVLAIKVTANSSVIGAAAWGARLLKVNGS